MYSGFCGIGVIFVIFCVPETKGRELESMAKVFRKSFRILAGKSRTKPVQRVSTTPVLDKVEEMTESTKC